ncbi:MAG: hypothetical protein H6841_02170 [Planctomycetes bacterium]|nr:hypothetical protein [Planctomycetota bacterium]MCB9935134.1 hypothetical protein [Planctomycetota bacterium]
MNGFRTQIMLLLCLLAPALGAQGVLTGKLFDAAGGDEYLDDAALVGAVALPADSPPFNELTATQWQAAFNALAEKTEPAAPLGGMITPITPTGSWFVPAEGDGSFRLEGLPLDTRLAVAAKIGELWWPLVNEAWLTADAPTQDVRIPYFRLGADRAGVRIEKYTLSAGTNLRPDLRYAPVTVLEVLRISNPDPSLAVVVTIELNLLVPPGLSAMGLPAMYGSQFIYMQGWSGAEPLQKPHDQQAAGAWSFGTGGGMHGGATSYGPGAHASSDNWHPLNDDPMLAMVGAGDTVYRVNPSPSGRSATLVFTRPVPPARQGMAGVLEIRLLHQGGVLMAAPDEKVAIQRSFDYPVLEAQADLGPDLTLAALVEGAHRRLYGLPEAGNGTRYPSNPDHAPDLAALEVAQLVFGFSTEAQQAMSQLEARAGGEAAPAAQPQPKEEPARFNLSILFKALALVFGLAFVGALVATLRKPRDKQLEKLAELPASRREVLEAVLALETEYKEGAMPARAYQDQRQRLLNRLVEFDAAAGK